MEKAIVARTSGKADAGWQGMSWRHQVSRFWTLLRALVYRDLKARYARSALGWVWIFLQPLFQVAIFSLLRAALGFSSGGMNYIIFVYSAILPWNFISGTINACAPAMFANASLIKKMSVPREVFLLSTALVQLTDFLMGALILAGMMFYFRVPLTWNLLWFPVLILVAIALALSLGFLLAAIAPFRGDVIMATPVIIQLWFFMTPVFYSPEMIPGVLRTLYNLNPAVGVVIGFRNVLGAGQPPDLGALAWSVAMAVILLAVTWPLFRHLSQYFADMM
jgi:lipopolysaccharide transport system permease protein